MNSGLSQVIGRQRITVTCMQSLLHHAHCYSSCTLASCQHRHLNVEVTITVFVLANVSLRSPRKGFILMIQFFLWIKVSEKHFIYFENKTLVTMSTLSQSMSSNGGSSTISVSCLIPCLIPGEEGCQLLLQMNVWDGSTLLDITSEVFYQN